MRVLSVQNPWAWLIVAGHKNIENRSWKTPYRGRVAIHASSKFDWNFLPEPSDPTDDLFFAEKLVRDHFGIAHGSRRITRNVEQAARAIIGTVELADIIDTDATPMSGQNPWCFDEGYAWLLENPDEWEKPLTGVNGKLNLWNFDMQKADRTKSDRIITPPPLF